MNRLKQLKTLIAKLLTEGKLSFKFKYLAFKASAIWRKPHTVVSALKCGLRQIADGDYHILTQKSIHHKIL